jgi:hypothetical protein
MQISLLFHTVPSVLLTAALHPSLLTSEGHIAVLSHLGDRQNTETKEIYLLFSSFLGTISIHIPAATVITPSRKANRDSRGNSDAFSITSGFKG